MVFGLHDRERIDAETREIERIDALMVTDPQVKRLVERLSATINGYRQPRLIASILLQMFIRPTIVFEREGPVVFDTPEGG